MPLNPDVCVRILHTKFEKIDKEMAEIPQIDIEINTQTLAVKL